MFHGLGVYVDGKNNKKTLPAIKDLINVQKSQTHRFWWVWMF